MKFDQLKGFAEIEYGRFQRQSAPATIRIKLLAAGVRPEGVPVEVDSTFLDIYKITSIQPQPLVDCRGARIFVSVSTPPRERPRRSPSTLSRNGWGFSDPS